VAPAFFSDIVELSVCPPAPPKTPALLWMDPLLF